MNDLAIVIDSHAGDLQIGRMVSRLADDIGLHGVKFIYPGENEVTRDFVEYPFWKKVEMATSR